MGRCGRAQSIHWHRFFVWVPRCRLFCPLLGGVDVSDMVFLGGNRVKLYAGPVSRLAWCVFTRSLVALWFSWEFGRGFGGEASLHAAWLAALRSAFFRPHAVWIPALEQAALRSVSFQQLVVLTEGSWVHGLPAQYGVCSLFWGFHDRLLCVLARQLGSISRCLFHPQPILFCWNLLHE